MAYQLSGSVIKTHWGRVTHECVVKLTIIGSDNGLSPGRRLAIIWTNAGILLIGPLGTNFSQILFGIQTSSFKKMHLKMSSVKRRPFCLGLNVLKVRRPNLGHHCACTCLFDGARHRGGYFCCNIKHNFKSMFSKIILIFFNPMSLLRRTNKTSRDKMPVHTDYWEINCICWDTYDYKHDIRLPHTWQLQHLNLWGCLLCLIKLALQWSCPWTCIAA